MPFFVGIPFVYPNIWGIVVYLDKVNVHDYCLMDNHYHLLIETTTDNHLSLYYSKRRVPLSMFTYVLLYLLPLKPTKISLFFIKIHPNQIYIPTI